MRAPIKARRVVVNALTIDVEDYFQVSAFAPYIPRANGTTLPVPRRAQRRPHPRSCSTSTASHATFFTLGWIAERYPRAGAPHRRGRPRAREPRLRAPAGDRPERGGVPRRHPARQDDARGRRPAPRCAAIARRASRSAPSESVGVRLHRARRATATARASTRSATTTTACPTRRASPTTSRPDLLELPVTTMRLLDRNWPAGGGGYFRLLPYPVSRWSLRRVNEVDSSRRCSTSIRGSSIPSSRGRGHRPRRRAFGTT